MYAKTCRGGRPRPPMRYPRTLRVSRLYRRLRTAGTYEQKKRKFKKGFPKNAGYTRNFGNLFIFWIYFLPYNSRRLFRSIDRIIFVSTFIPNIVQY